MNQSIHLHEWECSGPWAGVTLGSDPAVRRLAAELTAAGKLEIRELVQGLEVQATSFVGQICLGEVTITVHPKLGEGPLLSLLRYAYRLRRLNLFEPGMQSVGAGTFQELLIRQLAAEVSELLARGLHREYERRAEVLPSPRGRIDFQALARQSSADSSLPCLHHPRVETTVLNQALLMGMRLAAGLTEERELRVWLRRLAQQLALSVTPARAGNDAGVLAQAWRALDRRTAAYEPALQLIGLLLEAAGLILDDTASRLRLPGFLFDMNRFFQALLSRFLSEYLEGYTLQEEYRLVGMLAYDPRYNPRRVSAPTPRPDFVIHGGGAVAAVLDAKYRDLWERPLPREMLYQLALYALSQERGCRSAAILYPTLDRTAREARIEIREPVLGGGRGNVVLRPVQLAVLAGELNAPSGPVRDRSLAALARGMVFGR